VASKVVPEQQGELLGKTAELPHVHVRSAMTGRFAEVPLRAFRIVGPMHEAHLGQRPEVYASIGSSDLTETWMSITGLAGSPGTDVDPM
jgi:hypothetical protein